jgi:hypothetical protein
MLIVDNGVVQPRGPNQRVTCSGRVQARNTKSRGASKTRVIVNSWAVARGVLDDSVTALSSKPIS